MSKVVNPSKIDSQDMLWNDNEEENIECDE